MSPKAKPVIVLVHGAWYRPIHYYPLIHRLADQGYTLALPVNVTAGFDDSITTKTHVDDANVIKKKMQPYLDDGREIIVVCHSYGCIPGTSAVEGLTVWDRRAKGLEGGIKAVVYLAGFALPQKGMSLWAAVGGTPLPWWNVQGEYVGLNDLAADYLFNTADPLRAELCESSLLKQSLASFKEPLSYCASEITVPKVYIACQQDKCLPLQDQIGLAEAAGATVTQVPSGHNLFLRDDSIEEIIRTVRDLSEK